MSKKSFQFCKENLLGFVVVTLALVFSLQGVQCLETVSEVLSSTVKAGNDVEKSSEVLQDQIANENNAINDKSEKLITPVGDNSETLLKNDEELPLRLLKNDSSSQHNEISLKSDERSNETMHARWRPYYWNTNLLDGRQNKPKITRPTVYYDNFFGGDLSNLGAFDKHPCRRSCQTGKSLSCYYQLVLHSYQRLGSECQRCQSDVTACDREHCIFGDGVRTPVMAVNRMVPGPAIEVCENDTVVVDVVNYLLEPTTMHWHGLSMMETPDMDGAPYTTQYPVQPGELYRYSFLADRSGTLWYHSHVGWQRGAGIAGNFVIRQTRQRNRHASLYDYDLIEHTLMVQDIFYNYDFKRVRNLLINGKGRNHLSSWPDNDSRNRYERVRVSPGYRYRMRVAFSGISDCPIEFSIENHKMIMIASDGNDIAPIVADSFFISSAERFDFVLEANQYASNYWIRVRGYGSCARENIYQGAVLHYSGATRHAKPLRNLFEVELARTEEEKETVAVNRAPEVVDLVTKDANTKETNVATASLRSLTPLPWTPYTQFLTYYSSIGRATLVNGDTVFQIDDITFELPSVSLLQARNLFNENIFLCNQTSLLAAGRNCLRENCACTNTIRLPAYRPIEMVIVNYMNTSHPMHTHGYTFRVVGQGIIGNVADLRRVEELDRRGVLQRIPPDFSAVEKDTIQVPGFGYVIIRFLSNNPGFWMYHCHIEPHSLQGMTAILKIGELYQMRRTPPKIRC